ncbi:MAG: ABC transporter permease [Acidobacteriota bacterium]
MTTADALSFATRALRGHALRAGLSLFGVAIGVASVILLTSLGEGARLFVTGEFSSLGSNLLMVFPGKNETTGMMPMGLPAPREVTIDDAEAIARRVPQVKALSPMILGQADARVEDRTRTVGVAGTTSEFQSIRKIVMQMGRYVPPGDAKRGEHVCVIGHKLVRELFQDRSPLGQTLRLGDERFRVIGVMAPRGMSLGTDLDEVIHVPVAQALRMFDRPGLSQIMIEVAAHEEIASVNRRVLAVLRERHEGVEDVTVVTQDAVLASFNKILGILTAALGGIAAISLSVAGIGIMNVMLVSVTERTREIGLLKAVGVTRAQVLAVFLVEAALLSTTGGAIGVLAGLTTARGVGAAYPSFPVSPPGWAIGTAVVLSIAVGIVFGALPARRAARLDPVTALMRR